MTSHRRKWTKYGLIFDFPFSLWIFEVHIRSVRVDTQATPQTCCFVRRLLNTTVDGAPGTDTFGVILGLSGTPPKVAVWPFQPDGARLETMRAAVCSATVWDRWWPFHRGDCRSAYSKLPQCRQGTGISSCTVTSVVISSATLCWLGSSVLFDHWIQFI